MPHGTAKQKPLQRHQSISGQPEPESGKAQEGSTMSQTYSVIVRDPNSWDEGTGIHAELANCGHHHKSIAAAIACRDRLTAWRCLCGKTTKGYAPCCGTPKNSTSGMWFGAAVEDN